MSEGAALAGSLGFLIVIVSLFWFLFVFIWMIVAVARLGKIREASVANNRWLNKISDQLAASANAPKDQEEDG